jgi:hypothetical protein
MARKKSVPTNAPATVLAVKGFSKDLTCRGFQYEIGKTYKHEGNVVRCAAGGFRACEFPLDVFSYYDPANSRFCEVIAGGQIDRDADESDTKFASAEITIKGEIKIPDVVERAVNWILARVENTKKESNTGHQSAATNTGHRSAATNTGHRSAATNTGDQSAATNTGYRSAATNTGHRSAATNTGHRSAATNTGYQSAATNTGNYSAATNTGNYSAATNTGYQSAATNTGDQSAATNTGDQSAATNTGYQSAATNTGNYSAATNTGDQSAAEVSGRHSVACSLGVEGRAKAGTDGAIVLCYREPWPSCKLVHVRASKVGDNGIKPDTFYQLDADGQFVEVQ